MLPAEDQLGHVGLLMKITEIHPYPVRVGTGNQLLVKVQTDEGIFGWGESGVSARELAVAGAVKHYAAFLIGRDPMNIGALWQEMYRSQYFEGGRVLMGAISAIDIALHDLVGKSLNVPAYQLLGGRQRDFVATFATTSEPSSAEHLIADVKLLVENDWSAIRIIPAKFSDGKIFEPRESIPLTADWITQVREAVGSRPVLGLEYHHRLSVAEAASFCQRLPRGALDFLEEPIRDESPQAYESLRTMVDVPFAIGEEFSSKWTFAPYLERGILNFARIDVCNVGGLTEAVKVAAMAETHYVDLMPHNPLGPICTAATVHLAAAVPNFAWMEVRVSPTEDSDRYDHELFPRQPTLVADRFPVPEGPGLGVEVNEELLAKRTFSLHEPPHLHQRDGAFTNW